MKISIVCLFGFYLNMTHVLAVKLWEVQFYLKRLEIEIELVVELSNLTNNFFGTPSSWKSDTSDNWGPISYKIELRIPLES